MQQNGSSLDGVIRRAHVSVHDGVQLVFSGHNAVEASLVGREAPADAPEFVPFTPAQELEPYVGKNGFAKEGGPTVVGGIVVGVHAHAHNSHARNVPISTMPEVEEALYGTRPWKHSSNYDGSG